MKNIFILGLILLGFSCGQQNNNKPLNKPASDTNQIQIQKEEKKTLQKTNQTVYDENVDSLRFDKVLKDALQIAKQNIKSNYFLKEYKQEVDSLFVTAINLRMGYLFAKTKKHIIIHRTAPWAVYVNIYLVNGNDCKLVIAHEQRNMTYTSDTIKDINGDEHQDFIVNWYGNSGCCLKGFSNVYLYQRDKGTFTNDFEFINPTFSPKEGIIRGICYGHPGETEMYKFKWNGQKVDTISYVYYEKDEKGIKTGKVIESNRRFPIKDQKVIIKRLNSVPEEFTKIDDYDWFTGTGY